MTGTENGNGANGTPALEDQSLGELKGAYREAFGKPPVVADKKRLIRILASRPAGADPEKPGTKRPPRARGRARAEVAAQAPTIVGPTSGKRPTLSPGTKLTRIYRGKKIIVTAMEGGKLEYNGEFFKSLSALANKITGTHVSGVAWFGLRPRDRKGRVKA